jgi:hypothetical protein
LMGAAQIVRHCKPWRCIPFFKPERRTNLALVGVRIVGFAAVQLRI